MLSRTLLVAALGFALAAGSLAEVSAQTVSPADSAVTTPATATPAKTVGSKTGATKTGATKTVAGKTIAGTTRHARIAGRHHRLHVAHRTVRHGKLAKAFGHKLGHQVKSAKRIVGRHVAHLAKRITHRA